MGVCVDHAVCKGVIRSVTVCFVPTGTEFVAEAQGKRQARFKPDEVFHIPGAEERPPVHPRGRGIEQEARGCSLQKCLQARERRLTELAQRYVFVGLEALQPQSEIELMPPTRPTQAVVKSEQVSRNRKIASVVAAREPQRGRRIRSSASSHHNCSNLMPQQKSRHARRRRSWRGLACEDISRA